MITAPMTNVRRRHVYWAQNGTQRLTPRQRRRWRHKAGAWLRRQDNGWTP